MAESCKTVQITQFPLRIHFNARFSCPRSACPTSKVLLYSTAAISLSWSDEKARVDSPELPSKRLLSISMEGSFWNTKYIYCCFRDAQCGLHSQILAAQSISDDVCNDDLVSFPFRLKKSYLLVLIPLELHEQRTSVMIRVVAGPLVPRDLTWKYLNLFPDNLFNLKTFACISKSNECRTG